MSKNQARKAPPKEGVRQMKMGELDVLLGRGGGMNQRRQDTLYRKLIMEHHKEYATLKPKLKRTFAWNKIIHPITVKGGHFLVFNKEKNSFVEAPWMQVAAAVMQALRDCKRGLYACTPRKRMASTTESRKDGCRDDLKASTIGNIDDGVDYPTGNHDATNSSITGLHANDSRAVVGGEAVGFDPTEQVVYDSTLCDTRFGAGEASGYGQAEDRAIFDNLPREGDTNMTMGTFDNNMKQDSVDLFDTKPPASTSPTTPRLLSPLNECDNEQRLDYPRKRFRVSNPNVDERRSFAPIHDVGGTFGTPAAYQRIQNITEDSTLTPIRDEDIREWEAAQPGTNSASRPAVSPSFDTEHNAPSQSSNLQDKSVSELLSKISYLEQLVDVLQRENGKLRFAFSELADRNMSPYCV